MPWDPWATAKGLPLGTMGSRARFRVNCFPRGILLAVPWNNTRTRRMPQGIPHDPMGYPTIGYTMGFPEDIVCHGIKMYHRHIVPVNESSMEDPTGRHMGCTTTSCMYGNSFPWGAPRELLPVSHPIPRVKMNREEISQKVLQSSRVACLKKHTFFCWKRRAWYFLR